MYMWMSSYAGTLSASWNNNGFLQESFWNDNPSNTEIINALYGDQSTAYSPIWSGGNTCNPNAMSVVYLTGWGIAKIPTTLLSNTIYVLSAGTYVLNADVTMHGSCTALVGRNNLVTITYIDNTFNNLNIQGNNIIIDNINFDGKLRQWNAIFTCSDPRFTSAWESYCLTWWVCRDLTDNYEDFEYSNEAECIDDYDPDPVLWIPNVWNTRTQWFAISNQKTYSAINTATPAYNISINNVRVYDAGTYGIDFDKTHYVYVTNSQFFNNGTEAITVKDSISTVFHNLHIFNNSRGIWFYQWSFWSALLTITNSQIFNNSSYALLQNTFTSNNQIVWHNSQMYNNWGNWVTIQPLSPYKHIIYGLDVYNNSQFFLSNIVPGYGIMRVFQNPTMPSFTLNNIQTPGISQFTWRATGVIQTSFTMQSSYHARPTNASWNQLFGGNTNTRGSDSSREAFLPITFNYDSWWTRKQEYPVVFDVLNGVCSNSLYDNNAVWCISTFASRSWALYRPNIVIDTGHYIWQPSFGEQAPSSINCFDLTPSNVGSNQSLWFPSLCVKKLINPVSGSVWLVVPVTIQYINSTLSSLLNQQFKLSRFPPISDPDIPSANLKSKLVYAKYFKSYGADNISIIE